jgi:ribonuclease P protein component
VTAHGFPKGERLLKRREFLSLSSRGRKIHTEHFLVLYGEPVTSSIRIGITVSRKAGNAVVRNRCKRMIREFYRLNKGLFILADYNFIAKPGVARMVFPDFVRELTSALQRLGKK